MVGLLLCVGVAGSKSAVRSSLELSEGEHKRLASSRQRSGVEI